MQAWQWNFCPCKRPHVLSYQRPQKQQQQDPGAKGHTRSLPETYHRLRPRSQRSLSKQRFLVQSPRTTCMIRSQHLLYRGHFCGQNHPTICHRSIRADMFANKTFSKCYISSPRTLFFRGQVGFRFDGADNRGQTRTNRGHSGPSVRNGCACCLEPLNCFHGRVNPIAFRKQRHRCEAFQVP